MRATSLLLFVLVLGIAGGCGAPPASSPQASKPPSPPSPPKPPSPPGTADAAPPMVPAGDPPLDPAAHRAGVGVGKKGHYSDNPVVAPIAVPIAARFRAEEKLTFDVKIPHAMQLYKAQDPRGKGPKTHAEFMSKIIEANQIALPQLRDGEDYQYDPATEELMVVPKRAAAP